MNSTADKRKRAGDLVAWFSNVGTSVFIVFINKVLMDPKRGYGFVFATQLCALHFFASALAVRAAERFGFSTPARIPFRGVLYEPCLTADKAFKNRRPRRRLPFRSAAGCPLMSFSRPASRFHSDTLFFSIIAGTSISSLNLSLLVNSVGFYQVCAH